MDLPRPTTAFGQASPRDHHIDSTMRPRSTGADQAPSSSQSDPFLATYLYPLATDHGDVASYPPTCSSQGGCTSSDASPVDQTGLQPTLQPKSSDYTVSPEGLDLEDSILPSLDGVHPGEMAYAFDQLDSQLHKPETAAFHSDSIHLNGGYLKGANANFTALPQPPHFSNETTRDVSRPSGHQLEDSTNNAHQSETSNLTTNSLDDMSMLNDLAAFDFTKLDLGSDINELFDIFGPAIFNIDSDASVPHGSNLIMSGTSTLPAGNLTSGSGDDFPLVDDLATFDYTQFRLGSDGNVPNGSSSDFVPYQGDEFDFGQDAEGNNMSAVSMGMSTCPQETLGDVQAAQTAVFQASSFPNNKVAAFEKTDVQSHRDVGMNHGGAVGGYNHSMAGSPANLSQDTGVIPHYGGNFEGIGAQFNSDVDVARHASVDDHNAQSMSVTAPYGAMNHTFTTDAYPQSNEYHMQPSKKHQQSHADQQTYADQQAYNNQQVYANQQANTSQQTYANQEASNMQQAYAIHQPSANQLGASGHSLESLGNNAGPAQQQPNQLAVRATTKKLRSRWSTAELAKLKELVNIRPSLTNKQIGSELGKTANTIEIKRKRYIEGVFSDPHKSEKKKKKLMQDYEKRLADGVFYLP